MSVSEETVENHQLDDVYCDAAATFTLIVDDTGEGGKVVSFKVQKYVLQTHS